MFKCIFSLLFYLKLLSGWRFIFILHALKKRKFFIKVVTVIK